MSPANPQSSSDVHPGCGVVSAEQLQRMREMLRAMETRAANLETVRNREISVRLGVARRAAELADLTSRRLRALERPDPLSDGAAGASTPKPGTPRTVERPLAWATGLAPALIAVLVAFWASGDKPAATPPRGQLHSLDVPASARPAGPLPAPATHATSPRAPRDSPVFELYSPQAPAEAPR